MKRLLLLFTLHLILQTTFAQQHSESGFTTITTRFHTGKGIPHHEYLKDLFPDYFNSLEVNVGFSLKKQNIWSKLYRNPEYGFGFYHGTLGNKEVLGDATAIFSYTDVPIVKSERFLISYKLGLGLAYLSKKTDKNDDAHNMAIGSKLNVYFSPGLNGQFRWNDRISLTGGVNFFHFSNGALKRPNKGLNLMAASIGAKYHFNNPYRVRRETPPITSTNEKNLFQLIICGGSRQPRYTYPENYFASSLCLNYSRLLNPKHALGLGFDLFYYEGIYKYDPEKYQKFWDKTLEGFHVSHSLLFGRFAFSTHLGVYIHYKVKPDLPVYTRLGLQYQVNHHLLANLSLKSHLGKADFIEMGIGYRWHRFFTYQGIDREDTI